MTTARYRLALIFALGDLVHKTTVRTRNIRGLTFGMALLVGGCAGSPSPTLGLNEGASQSIGGAPVKTDCSHRVGRMQVRILQIRGYQPAQKTSNLSRSLQNFSTGIFGGTKRGLDPDAQYVRDVESLHKNNSALKSDGCKSFDIEAELKNTDARHTPKAR